jgi:phosphatidylinositol alpha-1,6-mannosyltransferase
VCFVKKPTKYRSFRPKASSFVTHTLLVSEIFPPHRGGSGRWFVELYRRLAKDDYLVVAGEAPGDKDADDALKDNLQIVRAPLSSKSWGLRSLTGLRFYFRAYRFLMRTIKAHNIKQIHCGRCLPEGVLGWMLNRRLGLPYLCFVHGEDIQTAAESRELAWIIRQVFRHATRLIANSHNTARLLRDNWSVPDQKIAVLQPGMDGSRFVPAAPDQAFLQRMGWDKGPVILTVGRLQRRKGQDMLIRALAQLRQTHPSALYAIIGDGEERESLHTLVSELGLEPAVQFLGEVDDDTMIRCYQQCTLFALPNRTEGSDIEGFGMVLAEAQACARPVLAGDSGGTRETMRVGETGLIVDCTAPEPLAAALTSLLDQPERMRSMGLAGREHVQAELDWPVHVARAKALFESLR